MSFVEKRDPILDDNSDDLDGNVGMMPKIGRYYSVPVPGSTFCNDNEGEQHGLTHFQYSGMKRLTEPDLRNLHLYE